MYSIHASWTLKSSGSYSDGSTHVAAFINLMTGGLTGSTFGYITRVPAAPSQSNFPLSFVTGGAELVSYTINTSSPSVSSRNILMAPDNNNGIDLI